MSSQNNQRNTFIWAAHRRLAACLLAAASWLTCTIPAIAQGECVPQPIPNIKFSTEVGGKIDYGYAKSEQPAKILGPLKFRIHGNVVNGRLVVNGDVREHPEPGKRNAFRLLLFSFNGRYGGNGQPAISYCVAPTYRKLVIRGITGTEDFAGTRAGYKGSTRVELTFNNVPGVPDKFRILTRSLKLTKSDAPNPKAVSGEVFNATVSVSSNLAYTLLP